MTFNWNKIGLWIAAFYGQALLLYPQLATPEGPEIVVQAFLNGTIWISLFKIFIALIMARAAILYRGNLVSRKQAVIEPSE